jgi:hypothetical protein
MIDEKLMRLTKLLRVREQRKHARERDRAERRRSRVSAEEALARQEAMLQAAQIRLDQSSQQVREFAGESAPTGDEMASCLGHLALQRVAISTERAAVAAAGTVCNVLRAEEDKASNALRAALNSHRKAESLHAERSALHRQTVRVQSELADDELNAMRAASTMTRRH